MEGHAAMDMSITDGPLLQRVVSARAFTAVSHAFFMSVASLWVDVLIGFLIAGALGAWVPPSWWSVIFLGGHGVWSDVWGAMIGPLVALLSFVCSVGNVPLAAVLWRSGLSFGGAIAFIFGDLIIVPILDIYRRYYTGRVTVYLFAVSYVSMVVAGLAVGALFGVLGAVPSHRNTAGLTPPIGWTTGTFLDIATLVLCLLLLIRFLRTGGPAMLRAM
jgi:uncharacterized membrane protein YraQ (UPF0718 family)